MKHFPGTLKDMPLKGKTLVAFKFIILNKKRLMKITRIHFLLRSKKVFITFTWLTRVLLAIAFIPSGIKKVLGLRFTQMGIENQVGFFFEALYRTGFYWNFLGIVQLISAVLLVIPKTSFFGAIIYLPIVVNILLIVLGMNFIGTTVIATLMLIGNIYLLFWDYPKTKILIQTIFAST